MRNSEQHICVDPSGFSSPYRLLDLLNVLRTMSGGHYVQKTRILIPSPLYDILIDIKEKREPLDKAIEIFGRWLAFYSQDHVEELVRGLSNDVKYIDLLFKFFDNFKPIRAEEYVRGINKLGEQSIFRDEVRRKLGDAVGTVIFEMLAVSHKLQAQMVSFGERTATLITRLGIPIIKAASKFKKSIKKKVELGEH